MSGTPKLSAAIKAVLCIAPFLCCREYIASVHRVQGESMQPALNATPGVDEWVLVNRFSVARTPLRRGEVVVLTAPDDCRAQLLKRVVALEGDIVRDREHGVARRIPAGHCWVEGDNALRSTRDSNKFGPVPVALVQGRVARVVWPPSYARRVLPVVPEADRYTRKAAKNKDAVLC